MPFAMNKQEWLGAKPSTQTPKTQFLQRATALLYKEIIQHERVEKNPLKQ